MQKKQLGWYLIFGGLIIFVLKFITVILSFIGGNPILGLALIAILSGVVMLALGNEWCVKLFSNEHLILKGKPWNIV